MQSKNTGTDDLHEQQTILNRCASSVGRLAVSVDEERAEVAAVALQDLIELRQRLSMFSRAKREALADDAALVSVWKRGHEMARTAMIVCMNSGMKPRTEDNDGQAMARFIAELADKAAEWDRYCEQKRRHQKKSSAPAKKPMVKKTAP